MKKLQKIQQTTGGRKLAVETIEKIHAIGSDHLIDKQLVKKHAQLSCCVSCMCQLLIMLIFAALVTFTVLYFMREYDEAPTEKDGTDVVGEGAN